MKFDVFQILKFFLGLATKVKSTIKSIWTFEKKTSKAFETQSVLKNVRNSVLIGQCHFPGWVT